MADKKAVIFDADNPEWTDADFARAKPIDSYPELAAALRRARGPQRAPTKEQVTMRLDRDVLAHFRAGGPGWQRRLNDELRKAAGL